MVTLFYANVLLAQKLVPYHDSVHHFHCLLPNNWEIDRDSAALFSEEGGDLILGLHKRAKNGRKPSIDCTICLLSNFRKCMLIPVDAVKVYAGFTDKNMMNSPYIKSNRYGKAEHTYWQYTYVGFKKEVRHSEKGCLTYECMKLFILHNDEVFDFSFKAKKRKFKKYKPIFLKIANSVYFDE